MKLTIDITGSNLLIDELQYLASAYDALAMLTAGAADASFTSAAEQEHVAVVLRIFNSLQQALLDELSQYHLTRKH